MKNVTGKGREEAGAVSLDVGALLADAKLHGEPVALKESALFFYVMKLGHAVVMRCESALAWRG